jgi:hypothetical protein
MGSYHSESEAHRPLPRSSAHQPHHISAALAFNGVVIDKRSKKGSASERDTFKQAEKRAMVAACVAGASVCLDD